MTTSTAGDTSAPVSKRTIQTETLYIAPPEDVVCEKQMFQTLADVAKYLLSATTPPPVVRNLLVDKLCASRRYKGRISRAKLEVAIESLLADLGGNKPTKMVEEYIPESVKKTKDLMCMLVIDPVQLQGVLKPYLNEPANDPKREATQVMRAPAPEKLVAPAAMTVPAPPLATPQPTAPHANGTEVAAAPKWQLRRDGDPVAEMKAALANKEWLTAARILRRLPVPVAELITLAEEIFASAVKSENLPPASFEQIAEMTICYMTLDTRPGRQMYDHMADYFFRAGRIKQVTLLVAAERVTVDYAKQFQKMVEVGSAVSKAKGAATAIESHLRDLSQLTGHQFALVKKSEPMQIQVAEEPPLRFWGWPGYWFRQWKRARDTASAV